jgi:hypothetical protein
MVETKRAYCDFGRRFKLNAIPHNETYRFFFPNQGEVRKSRNEGEYGPGFY